MKKIILFLFTFALLYFIFVNLDCKELFGLLKNINYKYILFLCVSVLTGLSFRGLCFKQLIYKTADISIFQSALVCITSSALNIVFPARAGDMFRAYFTGDKYNADKLKIFGAIMFERILDMVVICSLLFFAIFVYHKNTMAIKLCSAAFILMITSLLFAILTYKYKQIDKICIFLNKILSKVRCKEFAQKTVDFTNRISASFCAGFEIIDSPKRLILAVLTSCIIWFFECLNFFIILKAFNLDVHWSITVFTVCFIVFACLIPSASIFIGPYQIAVIAAFSIYGLGKETALALSLTEQAVVTVSNLAVAIVFLLVNNISFGKLKYGADSSDTQA